MKKLSIVLLVLFSLTLFSQIKGSGGPDTFGYSWIDSDEIGGPQYSWYDISDIGDSLNLTDEGISLELPLGFTFNYYGIDYTSLRVFANGYISFTSIYSVYPQVSIPDSGEPNNLISPFWNDLNPGAQGNIYYKYDLANSRYVIQYENIVQYGASVGNTFQVFLYEDGRIIFQYKDMQGVLNDCAVGIENNSGTDGLQVAFNQPYLGNNLAIKFEYDPFVFGGTYSISTNTLDYGNVVVGGSLIKNFTISNQHLTKTLAGEITTNEGYTVSEKVKMKGELNKVKNVLTYRVPPESSIQFNLNFEPVAVQTYNGYVSITSSDTLNSTDSIALTGAGVTSNIVILQTDTLKYATNLGGSSGSNFVISNTGIGDLIYSININYKNDFPYKGSGGPDAYGYFWKDSDDPTGPSYVWYDISSLGTSVTLTDESVSDNLPLGFNFDFYGIGYDAVKVYSNGYLNFGTTAIEYENTMLPDAAEPNGLLAGYWADLDPGSQGGIYYYYDSTNGRFIVQYEDIINYGSTTSNTFQIILYEDGSIEYQYKEVNPIANHTVGIENIDGTVGTQVSLNDQVYLSNLFAVKFIPTVNWLSATPSSSTIVYNDSNQIVLTCQNSNLPVGKYYADLDINSNDPDTPNYMIPVEYTLYENMNSPENIMTSIVGSTLTLSWDPVQYASGYVIYSSDDPYGTYIVDDSGTFSNESWSPTVLSTTKKFYRVVAVDSKSKIPEIITIR